ncbi:MAG: hypothetical protein SWO11_19650 [Thermodesulfobacteriota bacterium]|nr:hypothetical protein [Thermodesulfobacteriota bacterium]
MNKIKSIALDYANKFGQDSVLVVTTDAEAILIKSLNYIVGSQHTAILAERK